MIIPPPRPRKKVCAKMCKRCPFRPNGTGYAQDHPDLPAIKMSAEIRGEFYCHETALLDPRTKLDGKGNPAGVQVHFETCRGAWEYHLAKWRERIAKAGHTPGDAQPAKKDPDA